MKKRGDLSPEERWETGARPRRQGVYTFEVAHGYFRVGTSAAEEDGSARASQARLLCAFVLGTRLGWGTGRLSIAWFP